MITAQVGSGGIAQWEHLALVQGAGAHLSRLATPSLSMKTIRQPSTRPGGIAITTMQRLARDIAQVVDQPELPAAHGFPPQLIVTWTPR